ncbi:MAG TPA: efflux transporter outer membrane subunit [Acidiphilium sp.]|nr:MAG: RND transporter [Acidiphilium sp. 21-60-14]OYV91940.1 MAG: RND transporter [Acidiphilium sp. 37-60-79]OZB39158.1 MAG: RND transporter [Acidiphilium sp. 34-60-192]HQT88358.1 efflux transporter outer membrane subunit [Acidiphilium sp.]HQU25024.1 efflux transporter outer membrane subunit [Acidiphilium sp.]
MATKQVSGAVMRMRRGGAVLPRLAWPARRWATLVGVMVGLAGCTVGPRFDPPKLAVPSRFVAHGTAAPAWPKPGWWRNFGSPELDRLIAEARVHNFSVREAVDQLEAANAQIRVSGAPLLPSITGSGSGNFQQQGAGAGSGQGITLTTHRYSGSFTASYELDFWGKNRDALRAAEASAAAAQFNEKTVALTEEAAVATTYFQVLADEDQLGIAEQNLQAAQGLLKQLRAEYQAGVIDQPTVAQQAALVAAERATIPNLTSALRQQAIGLGILTGQAPEFLRVQGGSLSTMHVPPLQPGLPSQLLARRPDVAQATANLIAANDNVRGAIAAFFPSISLTGSAGWQSAALNTLISPGSLLLSAASSISQPIFEGGALSGTLAVDRATYREDVAKYEQSVVQAFTDVETAMTALHYATLQEQLQRVAVQRAQTALAGAKAQLQAGTVDVSTVLNAEQTVLSDQNTLVQARLTRFQAAVNLYKAMGGGWTAPGSVYRLAMSDQQTGR